MQQQYKLDFSNDDFELSRRVWRSIETLFNGSGLKKNLRSKSGARSVYQHSISPNFLFRTPARGGKSRKNRPLRLNTLWTRKGYINLKCLLVVYQVDNQ